MMPDDLVDNEAQELLGEIGVEFRIAGQLAEPFDLTVFTRRVCRRKVRFGLIFSNCLRDLEAFGEHEYQCSIDIIDAVAVTRQDMVVAHRKRCAVSSRFGQGKMRLLHLPSDRTLGRADG
jgi:hypothetical protein